MNLREAISQYDSDLDGWEFHCNDGDESAKYYGESCDGIASWWVTHRYGGFTVKRELGWYVQEGDANCVEAVPRMMDAMDAAWKAFESSMWPPESDQ